MVSSLTQKTGLEVRRIAALGEDRQGKFYAVTGSLGAPSFYINQFDGRRFQKTRINLPAGVLPTWGWDQIVTQDRTGEWWVPTTSGLYRFPALKSLQDFATARPLEVYTTANGMGGNEPFRLYEDSRDDLWMGIINLPATSFLNRWERATGIIHGYTSSDVSLATSCPTAFQEDRNQNLWIGFYWGGLARYRNGRFDVFTKDDGVPAGLIRDLYLDASGRLWVASFLAEGGKMTIFNSMASKNASGIDTSGTGSITIGYSTVTGNGVGFAADGAIRSMGNNMVAGNDIDVAGAMNVTIIAGR